MSLAAIRQELMADMHVMATATEIDRQIIAAMRLMRDKRMWWSERTFNFNLVQGQLAYTPGNGPPKDLVEIVGKVIWVLIDGDQNQRLPVVRVSSAEFEADRQYGTSQDRPSVFDFFGKQLRLYPIASSSTDTVEGRYVVDIGVPQVKYENGAFVFYTPDGSQVLSAAQLAAFNNDWLDPQGAYQMIKARAGANVARFILKDNDLADQYLNNWLEQVAVLEDETEARTGGATEISPCILDSPSGGWW